MWLLDIKYFERIFMQFSSFIVLFYSKDLQILISGCKIDYAMML